MSMPEKHLGSSPETIDARPAKGSVVALATALAVALPAPAAATTVGPLSELIASPPGGMRNPSVVYDELNDQYLVAWDDARGSDLDVFLLRLVEDPNNPGALILESRDATDAPNGRPLLSSPDGVQRNPTLAYEPFSGFVGVSWTDVAPGSGRSDVWFARVEPDDPQLFSSRLTNLSTGLAGTANDFAEIGALGSATGSGAIWMVAWQNGAGPGEVRGVRIRSDGLVINEDLGGPIDVESTGGAPSLTAVGDDFYVIWNDRGAIEARRIPNDGPVGASTSTTATVVGTSTNSQEFPSIAPNGNAQLFAAWQERPLSGRNVFGDRVNSALGSLGPRGPLTPDVGTPRDIRVAGDESRDGSFAVWQDFRLSSGGNVGSIFGARIDGSGNVVEEDGVLLIDAIRSMQEPAIAKGPDGDYLVVAVEDRTIGTKGSGAVWYRLVRDEEPSGTITTTDPTMIPADGVTPADLCFGEATGSSGLQVVDRTLYTLTWTSMAVGMGDLDISPPDVDPSRPEHQLRAFDGEVCFELRTTVRGVVDVLLESVRADPANGPSTGSASITFENVPPEASDVRIEGRASMDDSPRSNDDLLLSYRYFDVNGDPEVTTTGLASTEIFWRDPTNGAEYLNARSSTVVDEGLLDKGDQWQARIAPGDGTDRRNTRWTDPEPISNIITIRNARPFVNSGPEICDAVSGACSDDPDSTLDLRTGSEIEARWGVKDPDQDQIDPDVTEKRWFIDGEEQGDLAGQEVVDGSRVVKGQRWRFSVLPFDGEEFAAEEAFSDEVVVNNTEPEFEFPSTFIEVDERSLVSLDASAASDIDGDDLTFRWAQDDDDQFQVALDGSNTPTPTFMAPSVSRLAIIELDLFIDDGEGEILADELTVQVQSLPDTDGDTIDDELEAQLGMDPNDPDSDRDGLRDEEEVDPLTGDFIVDPLDADSDDDGVRDGNEGRVRIGDPTGANPVGDVDGDGDVNALDPDSDGDGILDGVEARRISPVAAGGDPVPFEGTDTTAGNYAADADPTSETSPIDEDTDGDGLLDGEEDANQNGRVDAGETDPTVPNCDSNADCASGEVCNDTTRLCEDDDGGGGQCDVTLAERNIECCQGSTRVDPICPAGATEEQCPTGSSPFRIGTCSGGGGGGDGGGCAAVDPESSGPLVALGFVLGILGARRRRRCQQRAEES